MQVVHLAARHMWLALKALIQVPLTYKFRRKLLPVHLILRALGKLMYLVKSSQENCLPAFSVKNCLQLLAALTDSSAAYKQQQHW